MLHLLTEKVCSIIPQEFPLLDSSLKDLTATKVATLLATPDHLLFGNIKSLYLDINNLISSLEFQDISIASVVVLSIGILALNILPHIKNKVVNKNLFFSIFAIISILGATSIAQTSQTDITDLIRTQFQNPSNSISLIVEKCHSLFTHQYSLSNFADSVILKSCAKATSELQLLGPRIDPSVARPYYQRFKKVLGAYDYFLFVLNSRQEELNTILSDQIEKMPLSCVPYRDHNQHLNTLMAVHKHALSLLDEELNQIRQALTGSQPTITPKIFRSRRNI